PIQAADPHLHRFCTKLRLMEYKRGHKEKALFTLHCYTSSTPVVKTEHIDYLSTTRGIPLDKKASYGLEVTYNNPTRVKQDAMACALIFFRDLKFQKPTWAVN